MEARHAGRAGQAAAADVDTDWSEPRRSHAEPEPVPMPVAVSLIAQHLPVSWARTFDHHRRDDGTTFYVDVHTGEQFDTLPHMDSQDGRSV